MLYCGQLYTWKRGVSHYSQSLISLMHCLTNQPHTHVHTCMHTHGHTQPAAHLHLLTYYGMKLESVFDYTNTDSISFHFGLFFFLL